MELTSSCMAQQSIGVLRPSSSSFVVLCIAFVRSHDANSQLLFSNDLKVSLVTRVRCITRVLLMSFFWASSRSPNPPIIQQQITLAMPLPDARPPRSSRTFHSPLVEEHISETLSKIQDKSLRTLFHNAFPNTLDTTVLSHDNSGKDGESWIITGDIPALWLRDSTNQVVSLQRFSPCRPGSH